MLSNYNMAGRSMIFPPRIHECMRTRLYVRQRHFCFIELFYASLKIINPSSKILCKPKFCVCGYGTNTEDNLNCGYDCSLSVLIIN